MSKPGCFLESLHDADIARQKLATEVDFIDKEPTDKDLSHQLGKQNIFYFKLRILLSKEKKAIGRATAKVRDFFGRDIGLKDVVLLST